MHILPPFIRKYGIIPESYKIAMTYEEQLLWLCKFIEDLKIEFDDFKTVVQSLENLVNSFDTRITQNTTDIAELSSKLVIKPLDSDLDVTNNLQLITDGVYYTSIYNVKYYNESFGAYEILVPSNTLFAYSQQYNRIEPLYYTSNPDNIRRFFTYDTGSNKWVSTILNLDREIDDQSTDSEIPTSKAVYDLFLQSGSGDYSDLSNKPSINNVTLEGNKTLENLGINFFYKSVGISQDIESFMQANDNGYYYTLENTTLRGTYNSKLAIIPNEGYLLTYNVGDTVTSIPFSFDGTASVEFTYHSGYTIKAKGQFVAYVMDSNRVVTDKYVSSNYSTIEQFSFVTSENTVLITWNDTTNYPAEGYYLEENNILIPEKTLFLMSKTAGAGFTPEFRIYPDPNTDYIYRIMYQAGTTYYDYLDVNLVNYFNDSLTHGDIVDGKTLYNAIQNIETFPTLTETTRILDLEEGTYLVKEGVTLYYQATGSAGIQVTQDNTLLYVEDNSGTKNWCYVNGRYITAGNVSSNTFDLKQVPTNEIESSNNKVTSLSVSSTNTQYPSAKCVYDIVGNIESILQTLNSGNGV